MGIKKPKEFLRKNKLRKKMTENTNDIDDRSRQINTGILEVFTEDLKIKELKTVLKIIQEKFQKLKKKIN